MVVYAAICTRSKDDHYHMHQQSSKPDDPLPSHIYYNSIQNTMCTYTHILLVLSIGESHIAQFKVSLPVLQRGEHRSARTSLPEPALAQDQVMDIATIFNASLLSNCRKEDRYDEVHLMVGRRERRWGEREREGEREGERERERGREGEREKERREEKRER